MKKVVFYIVWIFICLHTTVSFSDAATESIDDALAEIDALIAESEIDVSSMEASLESVIEKTELSSAPIKPVISNTQLIFTPWELIHRTAMMQGFTWGGEISNYITPAMYIGTPIVTHETPTGYNETIGATNYSECVRMESESSFGLAGELIEDTIEDELRNIAKYCATEYLGSYFNGKSYTTREEMLMFIFTMLDEDIDLPGYFRNTNFIFNGDATQSPYSNVSPKSWYAPYITLGYEMMMVEDEETWKIANEVSDSDIRMMFEMYLMSKAEESINTIETDYGIYTILLEPQLSIKKENIGEVGNN